MFHISDQSPTYETMPYLKIAFKPFSNMVYKIGIKILFYNKDYIITDQSLVIILYKIGIKVL
jgi:DNA phosphorothioation-dependent restriction protein DptG